MMSGLSRVLFLIFYRKRRLFIYLPKSVTNTNLASNMRDFSNDVGCLTEKVSRFKIASIFSPNNTCDTTPIIPDSNYECLTLQML